ncbi:MAG: MBL fold metallo-hydrolase [Proteobacteria bacterium]|nr:MBL fold metallo-hydrolase [Pseudomonadota bacterium]
MNAHICTACGAQYAPAEAPPPACMICTEERQYVPPTGQGWTTLDKLAITHLNAYREYEPGIIGIGTQPAFAIGQRALLVRAGGGNVLWDCIAYLDNASVTLIKALGGITAIAISHPHFYTSMVEWSRAFGGVPIHLHAADRRWVSRQDAALRYWDGETLQLAPDVTLVRCGGHFPGGSVLHWAGGAEGRGVVCAGDILTITTDRKFFSFMRSYPNFIPLGAQEVRRIGKALDPFAFERVYGHYFDRVIATDAKRILATSIERYVAAIGGAYLADT